MKKMKKIKISLLKFLKYTCLFLLLINLVSCAIFQNKTPVIKKSIKDVDYNYTRKDGQAPKKRVMVLPLLDSISDRMSDEMREQIREAFIEKLSLTGAFIPFDSSDLKVDLKSNIKNGEYDLKSLAAKIEELGIVFVLEAKVLEVKLKKKSEPVGLVRKMSSTYEVITKMKILNTRSQKEVFNTVKTITHEQDDVRFAKRIQSDREFISNPELISILVKDALFDYIPTLENSMTEVSWEGRIAAIQGEKIYLNVGQVSGLQVGDLLKVSESSEEIYDSEMGYALGKAPGRLKGTLEIVSFFGYDGSVAIIHSGAGFKENDRVEIYQ